MRRDAEINESADKKRKELIEARNEAESIIYQARNLSRNPAAQTQARRAASTTESPRFARR